MEAEVQGYLNEFNVSRGQIRDALKGLDDQAVNWQPLPNATNSIYAILTHLTGTQNSWMKQTIAGIPIKRDREAELHASGFMADAVKRWEDMDKEVDAILSKLTQAQLRETRKTSGPFGEVTVQWCILHQISHYALHLGHIQLTRQAWEQRAVK
jgi:uncharacterized damage-inducible protein DinB